MPTQPWGCVDTTHGRVAIDRLRRRDAARADEKGVVYEAGSAEGSGEVKRVFVLHVTPLILLLIRLQATVHVAYPVDHVSKGTIVRMLDKSAYTIGERRVCAAFFCLGQFSHRISVLFFFPFFSLSLSLCIFSIYFLFISSCNCRRKVLLSSYFF